ncbi:MAG: hypothetical protein HeimC3_13360 [Candidatus Heimdallarchaeota archaeon LC_3]|nr:MAG: hypothetical protein HeimC3_13360 [Candidatus Heimdallarchaeota archaeon LC_3]
MNQINNNLKYSCPFCLKQFNESDVSYCQNCIANVDCSLIKCPECGYEFPDVNHGITGKILSLYNKLKK